MELIVDICLDISYPEDRNNIIRKYLLPKLLSGQGQGQEHNLKDVNEKLLSDIFNLLEESEVEELREQIEEIVGEFETKEFLETHWKIGSCFNCKEISPVTKCKKEHHEECPYSELTNFEGCQKSFCDDCIFHICAQIHEECPAVRCQNCSNSS